VLIDAGPDFRMQALNNHITSIQGVLITHAHYDHTGGIDDLRVFNHINRGAIPCLVSEATYCDLKKRFDYILADRKPEKQFITSFDMQVLPSDRGSLQFLGHTLRYLSYQQLGMQVNGYCFGNMAYISDIREYPETIFEDLQGIEVLIISALRLTPSPAHFSVDEAIAFARRVGAEQTWITHIAHELDHDKTNALLPPDVRLAYDGLVIDFKA
jgi:phosphoribosyl 1,2-cyclic phosphate phosphodiesterase